MVINMRCLVLIRIIYSSSIFWQQMTIHTQEFDSSKGAYGEQQVQMNTSIQAAHSHCTGSIKGSQMEFSLEIIEIQTGNSDLSRNLWRI